LREAEKLVSKKIHPQTIVEGYRLASAAAFKALEASAVDHGFVLFRKRRLRAATIPKPSSVI
jgi:T-complex protein 1 subunit beta